MDSKVKVLKNEDDSVLNISENNPDYAWVLLQQVRTVVDDSGFLRRKPVTAILPGLIEDMKAMNFYAGQELPGKILIKESLNPFNEKDPSRDLKIAGSTGIVCSVAGQPIYRKTIYTNMSNAEDVLVQHDNVEQLRNAYAASQSSTAMKANTAFDI